MSMLDSVKGANFMFIEDSGSEMCLKYEGLNAKIKNGCEILITWYLL